VIRFTLSRFWAQGATAAALLAVIAVVLGVTGAHLHQQWDTTLGPCLAAHPAVAQLGPAVEPGQCMGAFVTLGTDYAPYSWLRDAAGIVVLIVPGLAGLFWGAPLIAPELHDGTWRLAWTQSITRTRWLAVRLAVAGAASAAVAGLASWMVTWWAGPLDQLVSLDGYANSGRFNPLLFSERGLVPAGYAVFAVALGATAGLLLRRAVPAMAVTLAGLTGARLAMTYWARAHLAAPAHLAVAISSSAQPISIGLASAGQDAGQVASRVLGTQGGGITVSIGYLPNVQNAWVFSEQIAGNTAGHAPTWQSLHHACAAALSGSLGDAPAANPRDACITRIAAGFHQLVTLQPASRYWPFQAGETAIFTAAALLLAGTCFWWIRHRLT
jgi:hypothetical protein